MKDTVLLEISNHSLVFSLIDLEVSSTFRLTLLLRCSFISFFVNTVSFQETYNMEHLSKFLPSAFLRCPPYLIVVHPSLAFMISRVCLWRMRERSITWLIVSITKFSIVIGSPRAYLSRNRRAITWVSNYWNRTPLIGYPRDFHVNYARFNGFLCNVFYSF